jgi:hypothetical protein
MNDRPVARCVANGVEAWAFPFYIAKEAGMEPAFLFLEDHVYNFDAAEKEALSPRLVMISCDEDLEAAGISRGDDGVWVIA